MFASTCTYILHNTPFSFVLSNCPFSAKKASVVSSIYFLVFNLSIHFAFLDLSKSFYPAFISGKNYWKIVASRNLTQPLLEGGNRLLKNIQRKSANNFKRQLSSSVRSTKENLENRNINEFTNNIGTS